MSIQITIGGEDRTRSVSVNSLRIENILTNKRDTAKFEILGHIGDTYKPRIGAEIIVLDGSTKIFAGVITGIESSAGTFGVVTHSVECQDYTRFLDRRLVPDAFENQTIDEIIAYLKANYFPEGFTINNVSAPIEVKYIQFKYRPLAKCIEDLAKLVNYDWYIDYDKDLHFFPKESIGAPFMLTDDNGNYEQNSLVIRKDNSQVRNSIVVRGGEYIGSQMTVDLQTNGVDFIFPLPYRFSDFAAHLTGEILSVGIDNIDDANNYDALYNFQEKIIKFKSADKPNASKTLKVSGKPYLPVIVRYRSSNDIASMSSAESNATFTSDGIYEYLIEDKSINSKEGARQRAQAEILAYAETLSEGEFITKTSGLRAGMAIDIQSDVYGIDETFIINKVTIAQHSKDTFLYKVSLITTRTMDLIDVLQRLLLQSTKNIEINPNETSDVVIDLSEDIATSDELGTFSTHGTEYRYSPSSLDGEYNFATWS